MIDWGKVKFRASSWGNLLTEPRTKSEGSLSVTCQNELVKIYNLIKYGRKKDLVTKQMEKGTMVEGDSITLFSMVEGKMYFKNDEPLENEWFTGHPDIFSGETIYTAEEVNDIKSSWELDTFTPKLIEKTNVSYEAQLNVYYDLTGAKSGHLVYCLVSAPAGMVLEAQRKLMYSMDIISEESPEYIKASLEVEKMMVFDDIDPRERVIKIPVHRNEELIQKMKDKVPTLRNWLHNFEQKHINQYL
jgi:hypothetical protein